jgi:hypothetical protein
MNALKHRILTDGKNLGNGILKVDGFINHQVDPQLMDECGREFAARFAQLGGDENSHGGDLRDRAGADHRAAFGFAGRLCSQTKADHHAE